MSESQHPIIRFAGTLKELAEGRMEPDDWLAWWKEHTDEVEAACPRGWFLKLKPMQVNSGANRAAFISQDGACAILESLGLSFVRSNRYQIAWNEDFQKFYAAEKDRKELRAKQIAPRLLALAGTFPKFARFLKKQANEIDQIEEPASEHEIVATEQSLGMPLPHAYKLFLECTRALSLDGLSIGLEQVFRHPAVIGGEPQTMETICIAEYWLEGDGDQVLVPYSVERTEDLPVYYYAHSAGTNIARELGSSITAWIESLPRSPLFRQ